MAAVSSVGARSGAGMKPWSAANEVQLIPWSLREQALAAYAIDPDRGCGLDQHPPDQSTLLLGDFVAAIRRQPGDDQIAIFTEAEEAIKQKIRRQRIMS